MHIKVYGNGEMVANVYSLGEPNRSNLECGRAGRGIHIYQNIEIKIRNQQLELYLFSYRKSM